MSAILTSAKRMQNNAKMAKFFQGLNLLLGLNLVIYFIGCEDLETVHSVNALICQALWLCVSFFIMSIRVV